MGESAESWLEGTHDRLYMGLGIMNKKNGRLRTWWLELEDRGKGSKGREG